MHTLEKQITELRRHLAVARKAFSDILEHCCDADDIEDSEPSKLRGKLDTISECVPTEYFPLTDEELKWVEAYDARGLRSIPELQTLLGQIFKIADTAGSTKSAMDTALAEICDLADPDVELECSLDGLWHPVET